MPAESVWPVSVSLKTPAHIPHLMLLCRLSIAGVCAVTSIVYHISVRCAHIRRRIDGIESTKIKIVNLFIYKIYIYA